MADGVFPLPGAANGELVDRYGMVIAFIVQCTAARTLAAMNACILFSVHAHMHLQQQVRILDRCNRLMAKIAELETKLYEKELAGSELIPAVHCKYPTAAALG